MPLRQLLAPAAIVAAFATAGCATPEGVGEISVEQLAGRLAGAEPPAVYDVNGDKIRSEYGVIPGATLLAGASDYDPAVLPSDKTKGLVFYCSNTWCSASKTAAKRARQAGYTKVEVLPAGIKGWKEAGRPTEPPAS
jgi:rhodanese-related sulfurtransferase